MKLVLVDNLVFPDEGSLAMLDVHPHLGLLALAAVAEADGHEVQIYDPKRLIRAGTLPYDATMYERAARDLLALEPRAVGFTTLGASFLFALNVAAALKRHEPDLPILLGGPHATMLDRPILERFSQFDVVVRHEADEILPAVLHNLERRRFDWIPGITWRGAGGALRATGGKPKVEDLDTLPIASYDHYPVTELGLDLWRIEAGRGCPFACTFCSTAGFFQRSFRLKSAERLVHELDLLHARYGASHFKLDHDMFTVSKAKVLAFCEAVAGRCYRWRASARIDCVDPELLAAMARAGCVGLYFGIETGSVRMQKICKKRLDLVLVAPILGAAEQVGIETTASFITGYPEEHEQDQDDTLDMIGRCYRPRCLTQLHILAPEPGTPMFEERGAGIAYDGYGGPYNAGLVGPGDEALVRGHPDLFQTYYYYPAVLPRAQYVFGVEAVDRMRRVGPIVLDYVLRAYGGQLSRLVRDLRAFTEGALPEPARVVEFIAARFGAQHHMTSLFRYALRERPKAAVEQVWPPERAERAEHAERAERPERTQRVDRFDPARPYQLNRRSCVLEEIHDCAALLARIARLGPGELLADAEAGELGAYVVDPGDGETTYWIDPGVQAIAELFDEPHTCHEVAELVCAQAGIPELAPGVFEGLVRAGVLVAPAAAWP
jgi:radical SAM superfamily enzyme YgiQ (UPF0313 family)